MGLVSSYNKKAFLFAEEGFHLVFIFYVFTPYDYLPPRFMPVVIIVVIMVLLIVIYNVCKVSRLFSNTQGLFYKL